jgi:hypothetical protein
MSELLDESVAPGADGAPHRSGDGDERTQGRQQSEQEKPGEAMERSPSFFSAGVEKRQALERGAGPAPDWGHNWSWMPGAEADMISYYHKWLGCQADFQTGKNIKP